MDYKNTIDRLKYLNGNQLLKSQNFGEEKKHVTREEITFMISLLHVHDCTQKKICASHLVGP